MYKKIKALYYFNFLMPIIMIICYFISPPVAILAFILIGIGHIMLWLFFTDPKNLKFTRFVIWNNELFKVGIFPVICSEYNFRLNKFNCNYYAARKDFAGYIDFLALRTDSDYVRRDFPMTILRILNKLTNLKYIYNMIEKRKVKSGEILYRIDKIYSYQYDDINKTYTLICDAFDVPNSLKYEKCDIVLETNNVPDADKLKEFIKKNSLNIQINEEQKYENSVTYAERQSSLNSITKKSLLMLFVAVVILFALYALIFSL